ncbi:MAG: PH domain-containing protein [Chloroflexota bacterium]
MAKTYLQSLMGENEEILFVTRRHWFILTQQILPEILIAISILVLIIIVRVNWVSDERILFALLILLLPLISLVRDVLIWNNHQYIVTTRRVIQMMGTFDKNVTDSSLEKVNDVKLTQSFLGRLFGFGNIDILTASELGVNRFTMIGNPILFKTMMLNAKEKAEQHSVVVKNEVAKGSESSIPQLIAQLGELYKNGVLSSEEFEQKKAELLTKM